MTIDPNEFRQALGTFATGITVVTTKTDKNTPIGVTINSFASVSLEPALVLFSLKVDSPLHDIFAKAEHFNVAILSDQQENISNLFAGRAENKFDQVEWQAGNNGSPVLQGPLSTLECTRVQAYEGGDHTIFIGQVTHIELAADGNPLLYFKGGYKTL